MARNQSEWMADIGKVCDELGYGILVLEPGRIELAGQGRDRIVIESIVLSATYLRRCLRPVVGQTEREVELTLA